MIFKGFLILLCGMPWGHLLFRKADIWHGTGHFFQVGLLIIFCLSFLEKPRYVQILNKPLGIFTLWAGLVTSYWWFVLFTKAQQYPLKIFLPFFNFLCFVWFYKLSIEYLDKEKIEKILKWFRYSILLLLFYCVLQYLRLDEFFNGMSGHDELVGTIGNASHLAGYLAIVQPIYFKKGLINILSLVLLWLIILIAGSASGIVVGLAVALFWLFMQKDKIWALLGSISAFGIITFIGIKYSQFFTSSHRIELWQLAFKTFKNHLITGLGLGSFGVQNFQLGGHWRHAHNEYFQLSAELGLVGLVLLIWCLREYFRMFRTFKTDLTIKLASMFFGFCLLAMFTFNAHLWMLSSIGMTGYSFLYCLKNEVNLENQT